MPKHQKTPEALEKAKTLHEMGWNNTKIAREFGLNEATIRRWLSLPDPIESHDELEKLRSQKRKQFVDEAWDIIFQANQILRDKIKEGPDGFRNPKDCATVIGIMVDKIGVIEARRGGAKPVTPPVSITILPPSDGHTTRIEQDTVPVYDLDGEVLGDDSGSGFGENVLRLPTGCDDSPGEPEEPGCDSGFDVQES
jgi:hypothetical protein